MSGPIGVTRAVCRISDLADPGSRAFTLDGRGLQPLAVRIVAGLVMLGVEVPMTEP